MVSGITIHETEIQQIEQRHFRNDSMEYPTYYAVMSYTLEPDICGRDFFVRDYKEGDRPRLKNPRPGELSPIAVSSVGVIGSSDGSTVLLLPNGNSAKLHAITIVLSVALFLLCAVYKQKM